MTLPVLIRHPYLKLFQKAIAIILALGLLYGGLQWLDRQDLKPETRGDYHLRYEDEQITLHGVTYRQRTNLTTILFMGVDKANGVTQTHTMKYILENGMMFKADLKGTQVTNAYDVSYNYDTTTATEYSEDAAHGNLTIKRQ